MIVKPMAALASQRVVRLAPSPLSLVLMRKLSLPSTISTSLLALRGGDAATLVKDFSGDAAGYFSGIRTPASLILGASLGALFAPSFQPEDMKFKTPAERLCVRFYNSCVLVSFMLSLCTLATATAAGVTIMHGNFDPMAASAYQLLFREFEFEFTTTRLSYLSSLLSFILGVLSRTLVEFNLLDKKRREEALVVCFAMAALVTHIWSYINSTLYSNQSLIGMALQLTKMTLSRALLEHRPLQILSVGCSVVSTAFLIHVVLFKKKTNKPDDLIL